MEQEYLQKTVPDLKVVSHRSLAVSSGLAVGDLEPLVACQEARNIDTGGTDALFLSGTNWRTMDVVQQMESDLGIPVFTANQVTMRAALRQLGLPAATGCGSLMDHS